MTSARGTAFLVVLAIWGVVAPATKARERTQSRATATLAVQLVVGAPLPDVAKLRMMSEAIRIWQREGVTIAWHEGSWPDQPVAVGLRVEVVHVELTPSVSARRYAVAEFHRSQRRIVASLPAADRTVTSGLQVASRIGWPVLPHVHALGLVLGRALAHEFGHYLLGTTNHAEHGLMRATFSEREFVDPRGAFFALDDNEATLLARRLDAGLLRHTVATH